MLLLSQMAKNKSGGGLGKALMKDRRKGRRGKGDEGWVRRICSDNNYYYHHSATH